MKLSRVSIVAAGLLAAAGCQNSSSKPAASSSAMDLSSPTVAPTAVSYAPQPAYVPPVQTSAPDTFAASPIATAAPMPASASMAGGSYKVKPGDTLWSIAASHYGDGKKWQKIVDANPGLTPSRLIVGKTIVLP